MIFDKIISTIDKAKTNEKIINFNNRKIHIIWTSYLDIAPKEKYKRQHSLGRKLLEKVLRNDYKIDFKEQMLGFNEYGKPYLKDYPDIHFNISHSKSTVILALSSEEIGIDIEDIYNFSPSLIKHVFTNDERNQSKLHEDKDEYYTRLWTLRESYLKYIGTGLKFPLTDIDFSLEKEAYPVKFEKDNEYFFQGKIGRESIFSVCTKK